MRNVVIDHPTEPMRPGPSPHFAAIRARVLLGMLVLSFAVWWGGITLLWPKEPKLEDAALLFASAWFAAYYALLALFLWLACLRIGVINQLSFGSRPDPREIWVYILLGVPMSAVAVVSIYVLYLPLSYFFPEFVTAILFEYSPAIWWRTEPHFLLENLVDALAFVVIVPVVEEIFFRGFLLNRWWRKYGVPRAVAFSSVVFAILHVDIIGALLFAVIVSLIYVKTKSLIGPIIVHASNNAIPILENLIEGFVTGEVKMAYTLDEFRAYWWLALLGAAVGVPWLLWFVKRLFRREAVAA